MALSKKYSKKTEGRHQYKGKSKLTKQIKKTETGLLNAEIVGQIEEEDTTGSELELKETHGSPVTSRSQEDKN